MSDNITAVESHKTLDLLAPFDRESKSHSY